MELQTTPDLSDRVQRLKAEMLTMPQLSLKTEHFFADGMYARVLCQPVGSVVVGKQHKKEHFYIILSGRVQVVLDEEVRELTAPCVLVSKPGTRRAICALEDSVYMTVHRTDKTDLDEVEEECIEPDNTALFDARNELRRIT
jgi:mannose-6-phosphate isomerase-like protein (cupin superfamily)